MKNRTHTGRCWMATFAVLAMVASPLHLQAQQDESAAPAIDLSKPNPLIPPDDKFPDGLSPTHVDSRMHLLERSSDRIIEAKPEQFPIEPIFPQTVRAVDDVRSMLRQADPACRYKIDAPESDPEPTPYHDFQKRRE